VVAGLCPAGTGRSPVTPQEAAPRTSWAGIGLEGHAFGKGTASAVPYEKHNNQALQFAEKLDMEHPAPKGVI
jgi:hypothetical protein